MTKVLHRLMFAHYLLQTILMISGAVALAVSILDADWFFKSRNAEPVVRALGRKRSRLLYALLGIVLMVSALFFYLRVSQLEV